MFQLKFKKSDWKLVGMGLVIGILLVSFVHSGHTNTNDSAHNADAHMQMHN